ncbi:HIT-type domain-containing protein [Pseudozyma hubeiensis]|nr:HIT-type domain-containing protein [Pseudozyma hubeiensis]
MSLSELLDISRTTRRDKARAQNLLPTPTTTYSTPARLCNICYAKPAAYSCPRCNIPFCSLVCFRKQEHQECSAAFSSSSLSLVGRPDQGAAEEDRTNVVDILARLERNEKDARLMQDDNDDDDDSNDDDADDEQTAAVRADVTEDQIESASTDALLAMLTEKERRKFLDAVRDSHSARALMEKLDRKGERRARTAEARSTLQGILVAPQTASQDRAQSRTVITEWQSVPWFDKSEASPDFSSDSYDDITPFVHLVDTILSAESTGSKARVSAPADLVYNLCTVLMAYAYILRHLDITSLSQLIPSQSASTGEPPASSDGSLPSWQTEDDDEPPPLEPDDPSNPTEFAASLPSVRKDSDSSILDNLTTVSQAFDKFARLVPFLFPQPPPQGTTGTTAFHNDHSKTLLKSLDDASVYLVSRLSLDSDVGHAGIDALNLQLLRDLSKLLHHEQLVPTFAQEQQVELKYLIASKFTALPSQQAFAAAQMPLLLNAVADLFLFFEHVASSASTLPTHLKPKHCRLVQRKLCFYLGSTIRSDRSSTQRLDSALPHQLRDSILRLRQRIEAADKADKIATAVNLLDKDAATRPRAPTINPI